MRILAKRFYLVVCGKIDRWIEGMFSDEIRARAKLLEVEAASTRTYREAQVAKGELAKTKVALADAQRRGYNVTALQSAYRKQEEAVEFIDRVASVLTKEAQTATAQFQTIVAIDRAGRGIERAMAVSRSAELDGGLPLALARYSAGVEARHEMLMQEADWLPPQLDGACEDFVPAGLPQGEDE